MKTDAHDMAFPLFYRWAAPDGERLEVMPGLTKRELLAAIAMQGLTTYSNAFDRAHMAVECADALVAALNKTTEAP